MTRFWEEAEMKTRRLLEEHWAEVDRVAKELLKHGDLSGKEVIKLIQETSAGNGHRHTSAYLHPENNQRHALLPDPPGLDRHPSGRSELYCRRDKSRAGGQLDLEQPGPRRNRDQDFCGYSDSISHQ